MLKVVIWQQKYKISHKKTVLHLKKSRHYNDHQDNLIVIAYCK